jgi:hypothetical protein
LRAKTRLDPGEEAGRQSDLGQQHQRLAALGDALGHRLQIDLGLARAGDALQQGGAEAPGRHIGAQQPGRRRLRLGEVLAQRLTPQRRVRLVAGYLAGGQGARFRQPLDHRGRHPGQPRQFGQRETHAAMLLQHRDYPLARRGHPLWPVQAQMPAGHGLWRRPKIGHPRRQPDHHARRGHGVFRRPGQEYAHRLGQVRHGQARHHLFQSLAGNRPPTGTPDHADDPAGSKLDGNEIARRQGHALGHRIIERLVERHRQRDADSCAWTEEDFTHFAVTRIPGLAPALAMD